MTFAGNSVALQNQCFLFAHVQALLTDRPHHLRQYCFHTISARECCLFRKSVNHNRIMEKEKIPEKVPAGTENVA